MKTTSNITGVFDLDTGRLVGLAPKGSQDVTYLAGQDTAVPATSSPVVSVTDLVTRGVDILGPEGKSLMAAIAAGGGRLSGESKIFGFGSGGTAIGAGTTLVTQHPAEYDFIGVQLVYHNQSASPVTVTKARCASTPTHQDTGATSTWFDATFAGSASGTIAVSPGGAANDTLASFLISDYIPCPSVARTDDTTKTPLLQARTYFAAAASGMSITSGEFAAWNAGPAAYGRQFAARAPAGDQTATFTVTQQPLEAGTWVMPQTVIYHYPATVKTLLVTGDSLSKGHLTTGGASSWPAILTGMLRSAGKRYAANNMAWTGQTTTGSLAVAKGIINAGLKPDYNIFFGWSPNNVLAASVNQQTFDDSFGRAIEHISWCRKNGTTPVVCTSGAYNALSAGQNAMRLANNARILALRKSGVIVIDFASVIDNPANNAQINPLYDQGDHLHFNDAGHIAMAAEAAKYF